MSDLNLTEIALNSVLTYGPLLLSLGLLLGALGAPLPGTLFVLTAGAFVQQGTLDWNTTLALGLSGVVVGDSLSYATGRFTKGAVQQHLGRSSGWLKAQNHFKNWGSLAIYLTRFLLTPLAVPTNLVAGGSGYAFWRFLAYDLLGELTWVLLFGGLGYVFGSRLDLINHWISDFSAYLLAAIVLGAGLAYLLRPQRQLGRVASKILNSTPEKQIFA